MRRRRVLLAGLFHETHTFLDGLTTADDCQIRTGEAMLDPADDSSPLSGALEAGHLLGWEIVPAIDVRAMPGPTVTDDVVGIFCDELARVTAGPGVIDGVFLVLHGAMISQSLEDVEGEVLRRVAALPAASGKPVCGVLDLHANFTPAMARHAAALIAYRENPHTDARQSAIRGCEILDRLMATGERVQTVVEHPPVMWPPTGTGTSDEPMRSLEALARQMEQDCPHILAVNVFAGFAFADTPEAGLSFSAVTLGDAGDAPARLRQLSDLALETREAGNRQDSPAPEVIRRIREHPAGGPLVIAEPSDNIGAGAPGDGTGLLRELVTHDVRDACVMINDPVGVGALNGTRPGERRLLQVGGRGSRLDPGPLELEVTLVSTSDGRFRLDDPQSHLASMFGSEIDMGPCAVVRHGGVTILLTSRKTPPFDLGQLRSQGIAPETMRAIGVKAAVAHRRAYDPIAGGHCSIDTPGPCSSNLRLLPYRRVRRPIFPLD